MSRAAEKALLPAGLRDILAPDAAFEAAVVERVMACFAAHGYERVKPPLIEFEDGLLAGPGAALASETFRLMDPVSQRMMGVRADMTLQVARIAASRLKNLPRPLRLSYAGQVLRVTGSQLRPERQFGQARPVARAYAAFQLVDRRLEAHVAMRRRRGARRHDHQVHRQAGGPGALARDADEVGQALQRRGFGVGAHLDDRRLGHRHLHRVGQTPNDTRALEVSVPCR